MNDQNQPNRTQQNLEELRELLPAYAMGFTDEHETVRVRQLLTLFPEEALVLDEYAGLSDAMLHSVPVMTPPAHLLDNLMQATKAEKSSVVEEAQISPPSPSTIIHPAFRRTLAVVAAVIVLLLALNALMLLQFLDSPFRCFI